MDVERAPLSPGAVLTATVAHRGVTSDPTQVEEPASQENIAQLTSDCKRLNLSDCAKQFDAVIICSDDKDDEVEAHTLKEKLNRITLATGDQPQIEVYDEVLPEIQDIFERLDSILKCTSLILAVMTPALVKEDHEKRQTVYGTFMKFLQNHDERADCFIPVYREKPQTTNWIPAMFRSKRGLDISKLDRDEPVIKKTFECHLSKRKEREQKLRDEGPTSVIYNRV